MYNLSVNGFSGESYINQDMKKQLAPVINKQLKRNGLTGSLSIKNQKELVLTLRSGNVNFIDLYYTTRHEPVPENHDDYFEIIENCMNRAVFGKGDAIIDELFMAMNNHNNQLIGDFYGAGWSSTICIGKEGKPYQFISN